MHSPLTLVKVVMNLLCSQRLVQTFAELYFESRVLIVLDLYYCVYHSVIYITTTCSNAKDKIYFVIYFQLLPNDGFSLLSKFVTLIRKIIQIVIEKK